MTVIRPTGGAREALVFQMTQREKALLIGILRLFPVVDKSFHQLSRDPRLERPGEQRLLEESMAQLRLGARGRLDEFLSQQERYFAETGHDVRLHLTPEQAEWLMRVLNDIRVGSWFQLGCPDPSNGKKLAPPAEHPHALAAMELSGYFQACLLQAFD